jgi:hypothetical protein
MKKWILGVVFYCFSMVAAAPLQERAIEPVALMELAKALGVPMTGNFAQALNKRGQEAKDFDRWKREEVRSTYQDIILKWAGTHAIFSSWKPLLKKYDRAIIFGSNTTDMASRVEYLIQLWKEGVRFKEVFWITGQRPLDPRIDSYLDEAKHESQAARLVYKDAKLPKEMRALPVTFLSSPMVKGDDGFMKRPGTREVVQLLINQMQKNSPSKDPGCLLFVSSQPFCGYQFAITSALMPDQFDFDFIGNGDSLEKTYSSAVLEKVARWLYEDLLLRKNGCVLDL